MVDDSGRLYSQRLERRLASTDGRQLNEWGEFCEVHVPNKIVMTRRLGANPLLGERETTLTYRLEPSPHGTPVTLLEEDSSEDQKLHTAMRKTGRRFWAGWMLISAK
jgi:hypothetical protein